MSSYNNNKPASRDSFDPKRTTNDENAPSNHFNTLSRMSIERIYADECGQNEANPTSLRHAKTPNYLERKLQEIHEENLKSIGKDIDLQKTDSELELDNGMMLLDRYDNENLDFVAEKEVIVENPVLENQNMEPEDEDGEMIILNKDEYEASLRAALMQQERTKPTVSKEKPTVSRKTTVNKEKMILDHEAAKYKTFEAELSDGEEMIILDREEFEKSMRVEASHHVPEPEPEPVQIVQLVESVPVVEEEKVVMEAEVLEQQQQQEEVVVAQDVVQNVQVEQNIVIQDTILNNSVDEEMVPRESELLNLSMSVKGDNSAPLTVSQKASVCHLVQTNAAKPGVESCKKLTGTILAPGNISLKKLSVTKTSNNNTPGGSTKKRKYDAIQENTTQNIPTGLSQELKKVKKNDTPQQLSNGKAGSLIKQIQIHMLKTPDLKMPNLGMKPSGVKSEVKFMMKENIPNESNQGGSSVKKLETQNAMKLSSLKPIRTCAFCERNIEKSQSKTLSCLHRAHNDCYITMERKKKANCPLCNSNTSLMDLKPAYQGVNRAGNLKF